MLTRHHLDALKTTTMWFLERESFDPMVLASQAAVLCAQAVDSREAPDLLRASQHLEKARAAGAASGQLCPAEIFFAMASATEDLAMERAQNLESGTRADMLAMLSMRAFREDMFVLASMLADKVFASGQALTLLAADRIALIRLLCGFRLGHPCTAYVPALAAASLPSDIWGMLASAVIFYFDNKIDECLAVPKASLQGKHIPVQSLFLLAQCLAETMQYDELCTLSTLSASDLPNLISRARWAAERRPKNPILPEERALAAAATFQNPQEFVAVASEGHVRMVAPGRNWFGALSGAQSNAPQASAVWVVRMASPVEFVKDLFNIRPPKEGGTS
jgi:hypothetical protein